MEGELTIRIDTWTRRLMSLPEKANEEATNWSNENAQDDADDDAVGQVAAAMSLWMVRWFLKRELRERRKYLSAIAHEADLRDARRDNDGFATAGELALAAVHVHFGESFEKWIFRSIFWNSLWGSVPALIFLAIPFGVAMILRWWHGRKDVLRIG